MINAVHRAGFTWRCPADAPAQLKGPKYRAGNVAGVSIQAGSGTAAAAPLNSTHGFNMHSFSLGYHGIAFVQHCSSAVDSIALEPRVKV